LLAQAIVNPRSVEMPLNASQRQAIEARLAEIENQLRDLTGKTSTPLLVQQALLERERRLRQSQLKRGRV
jgi:hypothetical protein